MGEPTPIPNTAAKLWAAWTKLYGWLGGHPTAAALIVGFLAGFVVGKL